MKIKSQNPTKTTMDDVSNLTDLSQKQRKKGSNKSSKSPIKGNRNFRKSSKKVLKCGN